VERADRASACAGWASAEGAGPSAEQGRLGRAEAFWAAQVAGTVLKGKRRRLDWAGLACGKKKAGPCELLGPQGKKEEGAGWAE
jgi:hypothetical protein